MRRDLSLIRKILLAIEAWDGDLDSSVLEVPGFTREGMVYQVRLLHEAGYIDGGRALAINVFYLRDMRLTWKGHDFLDAVRDDGVWKKVREKLATVGGGATLDLVKALAVEIVKAQLGLPG